jgi:tetratricopeptide (TPR) repeat protein
MKVFDAHSFKGIIYEVDKPQLDLNFDEYMQPGEITIFNLNKLKSGEYDIAVRNIVDTIFKIGWEESSELKMLIVFDEVHRLLEKYGGKGGYIALEKACREFRKWGIGLIMASQVNADFKEAVQGNILTEVQFNTKAIEDIRKIEEKYGSDYAKRISREGIGTAMMQNPKYNDGKPWFVQFRPIYHSPHKLLNKELELYKYYNEQINIINNKIKKLKNKKDVSDFELELKLAKDKLKTGNFRMTEIYINSLIERIKSDDKNFDMMRDILKIRANEREKNTRSIRKNVLRNKDESETIMSLINTSEIKLKDKNIKEAVIYYKKALNNYKNISSKVSIKNKMLLNKKLTKLYNKLR